MATKDSYNTAPASEKRRRGVELVTVSARLPAELVSALDKAAKVRKVSRTQVVEEAVKQLLEKS